MALLSKWCGGILAITGNVEHPHSASDYTNLLQVFERKTVKRNLGVEIESNGQLAVEHTKVGEW